MTDIIYLTRILRMVLGAVLRSQSIFDHVRLQVFFVAGYNPSEKKCFEKLNKMNNSTFNQKKAFMGIIYLFFHNGTRKHNIVLNFFAQPLKKTKTLKRGSNGGGCKKKFRRVYFSMILCIF